jgi:hypothetical protein
VALVLPSARGRGHMDGAQERFREAADALPLALADARNAAPPAPRHGSDALHQLRHGEEVGLVQPLGDRRREPGGQRRGGRQVLGREAFEFGDEL